MAASDHPLISAAALLAEHPECSLKHLQQFVNGGYLRPFSPEGRLIRGCFEFSYYVGYIDLILADLPGGPGSIPRSVKKMPREVYFLESEVERLFRRRTDEHKVNGTPSEELVACDRAKERITTKRTQGDITQKDAAAACNVSVRTIQNWDKGLRVPEKYPGRTSVFAFATWAESYKREEQAKQRVRAINNATSVDPKILEACSTTSGFDEGDTRSLEEIVEEQRRDDADDKRRCRSR